MTSDNNHEYTPSEVEKDRLGEASERLRHYGYAHLSEAVERATEALADGLESIKAQVRADERAKLDQERIEWENELIDVLGVGEDDDVDQRELIMQHARRLVTQCPKHVDVSQVQAIIDHISDMADSLDEHVTHDDIYGALGDLNSMVRELELTDHVDLAALTTALFELSHQPSFDDSTAGLAAARATAHSFATSYWAETTTSTPDVEWVRDGVCLLCGDGVLRSGEHLDPERHATEVERILADKVNRPIGVPDPITHDDEQTRTRR